MQITFESPDQPEVHALIAELDAYLYALYPAENHAKERSVRPERGAADVNTRAGPA
jgi:hypothetical protein